MDSTKELSRLLGANDLVWVNKYALERLIAAVSQDFRLKSRFSPVLTDGLITFSHEKRRKFSLGDCICILIANFISKAEISFAHLKRLSERDKITIISWTTSPSQWASSGKLTTQRSTSWEGVKITIYLQVGLNFMLENFSTPELIEKKMFAGLRLGSGNARRQNWKKLLVSRGWKQSPGVSRVLITFISIVTSSINLTRIPIDGLVISTHSLLISHRRNFFC